MLGNSGGDAPDGAVGPHRRASSRTRPRRCGSRSRTSPGAVVPLAPRRREPQQPVVAAALGAAAAAGHRGARRQVVRQQDQLDDMESALDETTLQAAANQAFDDPDAVKVQLQSSDGSMTASAVVLPDGSGYLMAHELPGLADDRTYQLWGDTGAGSLVSLGLLGADPATIAFQAGTDLSALAITEEEAGGVDQSQNPAVVAGAFD